MSGNHVEACSNCGKEGSDAVKLKNCTACFLVKYCSVDCQKTHRKQHKKACKKRAAELRDEKLYSQGHERAEGSFCPLCVLAIPFPLEQHATFRACCSKLVCNGCSLAAHKGGLGESCPFCRSPLPKNREETLAMAQKRVAAKDPEAICQRGTHAKFNDDDVPRAIELLTEAAELGSATALYELGSMYMKGEGVAKDEAKAVECWELAAMRGCAESRHNLGASETKKRKYDRAARHFLIAAKMGHKDSLDVIKRMFANGVATKAQYAEALKGCHDAVEEMKSPDRDEYKKWVGM
ncbi:hypothetical protein THAOC_14680 [Thalassiosira oceanica]|uniref:MYND-type domain-containing protein n=2 Tax=Thalassiosira oceanica TaxID=159749 RepID=K0SUA3_THAOC|nr:hypothetical protein THAOC_14680 [Thalassiosira oceanica]|eukprot:EJK64571.1 hypothetical protein THAOC_14680 [Thalassiosira oceanica]